MKHLLWSLGASFFVGACEPALLVVNVDPVNPNNAALVALQGERLFSRHCEGCHAEGGVGSQISFQVQSPVVEYATAIVREGRDDAVFAVEMPSYSEDDLSDDELNSILFFLRQAPRPTDGAGLYARFCANCHGDDASGGVVNENILNETDEVLEKVREGEGDDPSERDEFMPSYSNAELSNAEVDLIISFILSL